MFSVRSIHRTFIPYLSILSLLPIHPSAVSLPTPELASTAETKLTARGRRVATRRIRLLRPNRHNPLVGKRDKFFRAYMKRTKRTRRVAVYLETHCNIGSNTAFPTGVLDRWHNCLLIYWRTSCLVPAFDDT